MTGQIPVRPESATVHIEDVRPVGSRISWGAIVAGSVLALALYFLLTMFGSAVGFSISGHTSAHTLGIAAAVSAIFATVVCLFVGGFIASQLTVGENQKEAALYGLLVWAVVFAMLLWLMATGVRTGFNAMLGVAATGTVAAANTTQDDWEATARRAGFTQSQIDDVRDRVKKAPADARAAVEDPTTRSKAEDAAREFSDHATKVTWYAFLGTLLSMLAAAAGGYVGAGPTFRLFAVRRVRPGVPVRP